MLEEFPDGHSINGSPETSCINRKGFLTFLSYLPSLFKTLHMSLCCLEGSTMSNLVHRRMRCARTDLHSILCLEGSTPEDVRCIYVYRLAIDARPKRGDGVAGRKWPSLLGDFQTGIASMTRKRHLASTARGFYCFRLTPTTGQYATHSTLLPGRQYHE